MLQQVGARERQPADGTDVESQPPQQEVAEADHPAAGAVRFHLARKRRRDESDEEPGVKRRAQMASGRMAEIHIC